MDFIAFICRSLFYTIQNNVKKTNRLTLIIIRFSYAKTCFCGYENHKSYM